ncbi:sialate O-acetylesterase [Sphingobium algorifonticola]|uniref:Sialate O-acetylesterase domain-containing protein n=1 Tax=Sphingobium algorifonticola TaxID=2008318 RepID=A0A437J444_9SPHN|nr:sialate O-acetylesterase [Sphingobium algorifonticola]RVT39434.1 hypothetical protein ENE74_15435 [Sphingobium algorifonticola]
MSPRAVLLARFAAAIVVFSAHSASAAPGGTPELLSSLFANHMVLQRDTPIRLWGRAAPGAKVRVTLSRSAASTRADSHGNWTTALAPLSAGGPYRLEVESGGIHQTVEDVLIGDLWLCSGQSNMAMPVSETLGGASAITASRDSGLRLLKIERRVAAMPETRLAQPVRWQEAAPETSSDFAAACYFFGRKLRQARDVPVGLVSAAWGGTTVDAWRPQDALRATQDRLDELPLLEHYSRDPASAQKMWAERWQNWWRIAQNGTGPSDPWAPGSPPEMRWQRADIAMDWSQWHPGVDGANRLVFFRSTFDLPPADAKQVRKLTFGPVRFVDLAWINGQFIASTSDETRIRSYRVPDQAVTAGRNSVVIAVRSLTEGGGFASNAVLPTLTLADGRSLPLGRSWEVLAAPATLARSPLPPWDARGGISGPYNAMIAPLGKMSMAGVVWYQGEAETLPDRAPRYQDRLASLIAAWRKQFDDTELPFLIVQLPEYRLPSAVPGPSHWATVREAQRRIAGSMRNVLIVPAMGLGEANDIHPANKADLGVRLAAAVNLLATRKGAGPIHMPMSIGPSLTRIWHTQEGVRMRFSSDGPLRALSADMLTGFETCDVGGTHCRFVVGAVDAGDVILKGVHSPRIRYGWADHPIINLTDDTAIPAIGFDEVIAQ